MTEIPVYLFTGFLEAGKTTFMQETLADESFNKGEKTLIVLCEEGETELDFSAFPSKNTFIGRIDGEQELKPEKLEKLRDDCKAQRVIIEYNGMWQLDALYAALPESWNVYQEMSFFDGSTVAGYNANMRTLVVDKIKSAETVVFNRLTLGCDKSFYHKLVRAVSRNANIIYEHTDGSIEVDETVDPLPFDINADIIEIGDNDYAYWYRDFSEDVKKYIGKKVKFKGLLVKEDKFPKDTSAFGRQIMVCCEADIAYRAFALIGDLSAVSTGSWITATVKIDFEFNKIYKGKGPVLKLISYEAAERPDKPVSTFY